MKVFTWEIMRIVLTYTIIRGPKAKNFSPNKTKPWNMWKWKNFILKFEDQFYTKTHFWNHVTYSMVIKCTLHTILPLRIKQFFNPKGKGYNISVITYMCLIGLGVGVHTNFFYGQWYCYIWWSNLFFIILNELLIKCVIGFDRFMTILWDQWKC
jgi:hypothetical protein